MAGSGRPEGTTISSRGAPLSTAHSPLAMRVAVIRNWLGLFKRSRKISFLIRYLRFS
jgi:hypothetical protein